MSSNHKLGEKSSLVIAILNADITTDRTSSYYAAKGYRRARVVLRTDSTLESTKVATVEFLEATDSSGTGAQRLGSLQTFTSNVASGELAELEYEVDLDTMSSTYTHIAVKVTSNSAAALDAAVALELGEPRFKPAPSLLTAS